MTAPDERVRRIVHIDMDAFFASVEQRDDPALRGKPVAVGGARARGVVAAASYEARKFGVRSAMPSLSAQRACPELIFVKPRFEVYRAVSHQIREIFSRYTPLIEPLSLDEAYLDLTEHLPEGRTASDLAREIRAAIRAETGLTASAGISYNKFLAKIASDQRKPDGQFTIPPEHGAAFVASLPVHKFHGVGPATAARMLAAGIETGADLRARSRDELVSRFGKSGDYYYNVARGIDTRPVRPDRIRKSVGAEQTYPSDLTALDEARAALEPLADKVWAALAKHGRTGRTVTLKVKFADFCQITRARSLAVAPRDAAALVGIAGALLADVMAQDRRGIRLLGITVSALNAPRSDEAAQLDLFDMAGCRTIKGV